MGTALSTPPIDGKHPHSPVYVRALPSHLPPGILQSAAAQAALGPGRPGDLDWHHSGDLVGGAGRRCQLRSSAADQGSGCEQCDHPTTWLSLEQSNIDLVRSFQ